MALIAVPDNRLVTSELHLSKNVTIGVRVLIHLSPFFILSAPVLGSTSVFSNVCLGNLALQFPCLLIQPLRSFFCFFSAGIELRHLWTFDLRIKSSTVFLKFCHQLAVFSQYSHLLQSHSVGFGGASGKVWVGSLYSLAFIFSSTCSLTSSMVPVMNSPTCTLSKYSTILFWKSEFGSIIRSLISCGDNEFRIQRSMCRCKVSLPCCSTVA